MKPSRKRKLPNYKNLRLKKRIKHPISKPIPSVFKLLLDTSKHIWKHKRIFISMIGLYFLLNLIFVKGLTSGLDIPAVKSELQQTSQLSGVDLGTTLIAIVAGDSNTGLSEVASFYQTLLLIIFSVAFIWLFRQTHDFKKAKRIKFKQPFYEGMTPIIPFVLQLLIIGVQLLPMVAGVSLFSIVQVNGIATNAIETSLWGLLALLLVLLSFYWLSASVLSLIIVTLPDMTPIKAYKTSKKVVEFRRFIIMRKLFLFAIVILLIFGGVLFLTVMTVPILTELVMLLLSAIALPLIIGSGYKLYRTLL